MLGFYRVATLWHNTPPSIGEYRFNPVLGFYRVATVYKEGQASETLSFNPVLGFYRVATVHHAHPRRP